MVKASLKTKDGTLITLDGDPEEVHRLLQMYEAGLPVKRGASSRAAHGDRAAVPVNKDDEGQDRVASVVNQIKSSEALEAIEARILDERSQLNRVLLPLFVVHEEMGNAFGLTSGEIAKITRELGVPVGQPDVSKLLAAEASRYVLGDATRSRGKIVRYKLSRRGAQHLGAILSRPG